jgi:hypothetical protein
MRALVGTGQGLLNHGGLSAALQSYEVAMFPRAQMKAAGTVSNMQAIFPVESAAKRLVEIVKNQSA